MAKKKAAARKPATAKKSARKAAKKKSAPKKKRTSPRAEAPTAPVDERFEKDRQQYQQHSERTREDQARKASAGRQIKPAIEKAHQEINRKRREACRLDFKRFCETYAPGIFELKWSPAHLRVIERIETAVLKGGLFAVAMPRGSGKTALSTFAVVWAIAYGHRRSAVLLGATGPAADELMVTIKAILEGDGYPEFAQDFPEISVPCAELDGKAAKAVGQRYGKKRSRIRWEADTVILPQVEDSPSRVSGIRTRGLGSHMRGMYHMADGKWIRPDLFLLDDPQPDDSASSEVEVKKRLKTIEKGLRGLVGPGKRMSGIMPCTVIEPDDVADKVLSGMPGWAAERIPMMLQFDGIPPETADLWEELREIYAQEMNSEAYPRTNAYYRKHRKKLDKGLKHYWPERVEDGFVSAIQHAMCWYMTRPESFWSECQQQPLGNDDPDADLLSVDEITLKQHNAREAVVPNDADVLVSFIDVQHSLLFYVVMAFNRSSFTGYVVEYGAWPRQRTRNFHMSQARPKLADDYKGRRKARLSLENVIRLGIKDCVEYLFAKAYRNEKKQLVSMDRLAIDCSDGNLSNRLREIIEEMDNPRVFAAFGRKDELTGKEQRRDKAGDRWRARDDEKFNIRKITYQPNHWKSFAHKRLATDSGEKGSVSLFYEKSGEEYRHKTFAEHLRSEKRKTKYVRTSDGEEKIQEWHQPPGCQNHWFDGFVGCHVLAAHEGCQLWSRPIKEKGKAKLKLSEMQKRRNAA